MKKKLVSVAVLAAFALGVVASPLVHQAIYMVTPQTQAQQLEAVVAKAAKQVKLPHKNDDNTTLVDLRADTDAMAIVYQLEVRGLAVTDEGTLKKSIKNGVKDMCDKDDAQQVLKTGVHYKWIHYFVDADKAYTTTLTEADCATPEQAANAPKAKPENAAKPADSAKSHKSKKSGK